MIDQRIALGLFVGIFCIIVAMLWRNHSLQAITVSTHQEKKEGFEEQITTSSNAEDSTKVESVRVTEMVRVVLNPYYDARICPLFTQIRDRITATYSPSGNLGDAEAVKKATVQLQTDIPGGPPPCPLPTMPPATADPTVWLAFVQALPDTLLAQILFTCLYIQKALKKTLHDIETTQGGGQDEGFSPLCPPQLAEERKKRLAAAKTDASAADADSCRLPEEIPREELASVIQDRLIKIRAASDSFVKEKLSRSLTDYSISQILDDCMKIKQKLDEKQRRAEAGDVEYPKIG